MPKKLTHQLSIKATRRVAFFMVIVICITSFTSILTNQPSYAATVKTVTPPSTSKAQTTTAAGLDLVVIQCEAFMDIEKTYDIQFSKDPLPKYHEWQQKSLYGMLHVPVNGGLTCNSEYEFLTSKKAASLAYIPFKDVLHKTKGNIDSLAWDLKKVGFKTVGIHPYHKTYFNRNVVYPKLGIDRFITLEDFHEPGYYGSWVKDKESFSMVLKELDKAKGKDTFIYNVTVQNHAPYYAGTSKNPIRLKSDKWLADDRAAMEVYVTGLSMTDIALDTFMKRIESRKKRTVVIFYGDHQPPKGYKSLGNMDYFKDNGNFVTDYFIYDNKGMLDTGGQEMKITDFRHIIQAIVEK